MIAYLLVVLILALVGLSIAWLTLFNPRQRGVVPQGAQLGALLIFLAVFGFFSTPPGRAVAGSIQDATSGLDALWFGAAVGLFSGSFLLVLGYIYGDAKRRDMPALGWLLAVLFIPNLIGVILYFLFRKPLLDCCALCGRQIVHGHPFCSYCGGQQPSTVQVTA